MHPAAQVSRQAHTLKLLHCFSDPVDSLTSHKSRTKIARFLNYKYLSQFQNVQFCSRSRKAKILTTGIHGVFRGLKFESDADIGQISADFERGRFEIGSSEII